MKGFDLPTRQLVSQADSARIENANVPRSKFLNTWTRKTAFDAGKLYPIMVDELLPGDHMTYDVTAYVRMATPLFPLFDNQRVDTHFFFVPNRLVWDNWVKMMGEQSTPGDSIAYTIPQIVTAVGGEPIGSVYDHFGIPGSGQVAGGESISVNALPLRAYNAIWNTWFRDENSIGPMPTNRGDGPDSNADYFINYRAKAQDYFTTALPWPQKFTAPTVPLSGMAPVLGIGFSAVGNTGAAAAWNETGGAARLYSEYVIEGQPTVVPWAPATQTIGYDTSAGYPAIYADLAQSTGVAINVLRQAWMVQSLLERDARGGTRYTELIRSHFGVINPDFRLQRPEYIGGGQSNLNITPIAQTAPSAGVPVGALGAAGTAAGSHRASYAATEHGYVIGLISVRTELSYQQGLHKLWTRQSRYDFYWPALAGLGEQAILRQELYATGNNASDATVFGYQERWQEYRTRYSDVTGVMRSTAAGTLDAWHLAQKFLTAPFLQVTFIQEDPPMARVLAAGALAEGQEYLADIMYHRAAVRPIPTFGTPALLGRF